MKRQLVGTALGRIAISVRQSFEAMTATYSRPEIVGMLANERIAAFLMARLCRPGGIFIDAGAHIGSVIAEVSRNDPTVRIIAIEAIPEKVAGLRRLYPAIEIHECALGESDGEARFFVHAHQSGFSSLGRTGKPGDPNITEIKVPLRKLDGLVAADDVDMIKIDVEGAELGVIRGGERVITSGRPTLTIESVPAMDDGLNYTKREFWDWFDGHGYVLLIPNRVAYDDPGLSLAGFLESHLYPMRTLNYYAVARERRAEIRDRAREILKLKSV